METRYLGQTGIEVSVIGLGCNAFGIVGGHRDKAQRCIDAAIDSGITFFDMASEHGFEEEVVGKAIGKRRKDVVISTKLGHPEIVEVTREGARFGDDTSRQGLSRHWIIQTVEQSLKRLGTDYIDLYQTHALDEAEPREETLRAFDDLVTQGKVRAVGEGATFATADDLRGSLEIAEREGLRPFVSIQSWYNLLQRGVEGDIIPELRRRKMSLIPFVPLASGLLTGKYRDGVAPPPGSRFGDLPFLAEMFIAEDTFERIARFQAFADERGMSLSELALRWLVSEPVVASVIAGASREEQVLSNAAAGTPLSADDYRALCAIV